MLVMAARRSVTDAKSHVAACLASAEAGEQVVITRHGRPVAAIVSAEDLETLERHRDDDPDAGLAGLLASWTDEDEPLADDLIDVVARRSPPRRAKG